MFAWILGQLVVKGSKHLTFGLLPDAYVCVCVLFLGGSCECLVVHHAVKRRQILNVTADAMDDRLSNDYHCCCTNKTYPC